jgi:hypothetical protein
MKARDTAPALCDFIAEVDEAKAHTQQFTLWPKRWKEYVRGRPPAFSWVSHPFNAKSKKKIPEEKGLYTFVVSPNIAQHCCSYLMYVGVAAKQTLRKRFGQYLSDKRNPNARPQIVRLLNKYSDKNLFFCCVSLPTANNLKKLEEDLIEAFLPPCNPKITGKVGRIKRAF